MAISSGEQRSPERGASRQLNEYAMFPANPFEYLARRLRAALRDIFESLAESLVYIGTRREIEQALIRLGGPIQPSIDRPHPWRSHLN